MRFVFLCFALALAPLTGRATPPDDLRALLADGDYAGVEAMFAAIPLMDAQAQHSLFHVFYATDPQLYPETEAWIAARPGSAYAHTARGWLMYAAGGWARGTSASSQTAPKAMQRMNTFFTMALDEAAAARRIDPDLVSPAELQMRLYQLDSNLAYAHARGLIGATATASPHAPAAFDPGTIPEVVAQVMAHRPNFGTLRRAMEGAQPKWGGSVGKVLALCLDYATNIPDAPGMTIESCSAYAILTNRLLPYVTKESAQRAISTLATSDAAFLNDAWMETFVAFGTIPPEWRDKADALLALPDMTDARLGWVYDRSFPDPARPHAMAAQRRLFDRKVEIARREIGHDPYNPQYLATMAGGLQDGGWMPDPAPTLAEQSDYTRRALVASPYDADLWQGLGNLAIVSHLDAQGHPTLEGLRQATPDYHQCHRLFALRARSADQDAVHARPSAGPACATAGLGPGSGDAGRGGCGGDLPGDPAGPPAPVGLQRRPESGRLRVGRLGLYPDRGGGRHRARRLHRREECRGQGSRLSADPAGGARGAAAAARSAGAGAVHRHALRPGAQADSAAR